ncbi:putative LRR receptor-like serine/threonine-protein kinase [Planoprotostelium fungivorum]|uniref:Putative LRR receptor-like serine/threonine-protein kinase n=1 Tax=Planoprotostelium fungivorum TaxID=1890364 RepID=A0A2P6NCR9_9EUKA|nr:putative LRR receptor-like serine/threonine-protein kinase [Planoprotostelium fungivorum]
MSPSIYYLDVERMSSIQIPAEFISGLMVKVLFELNLQAVGRVEEMIRSRFFVRLSDQLSPRPRVIGNPPAPGSSEEYLSETPCSGRCQYRPALLPKICALISLFHQAPLPAAPDFTFLSSCGCLYRVYFNTSSAPARVFRIIMVRGRQCLLVILFLSCLSVGVQAAASAEVKTILLDLWTATGPYYGASVPWDQTTDPCEDGWDGIGCDTNGTVVHLELDYFNLYGRIPNSFSNLTTLQFISMAYNGFNFDDDGFPDLSRMTQLTHLDLTYVYGSTNWYLKLLPPSLEYLDMSSCYGTNLTGATEALVPVKHLTYFALFDISNVLLIDFDLLTQYTKIDFLNLGNLGLTGDTPAGFFKIKSLFLYGNNMKLVIPEVCNIERLLFNDNALQQDTMPSFKNCTNLQFARLDGNNFKGEFELSFPCHLKSLDLSGNSLTGSIDFTNCTSLQELNLAGNQIAGPLPNVTLMTKLTSLTLSGNLFYGEIPDMFQRTTLLSTLDLSTNLLSGRIPPSLFNISGLQSISLNDNSLSGSIPPLFQLQSLKYLDLSFNNFSGTVASLPPSVRTLSMSFNQLEGRFPSAANLSSLIHLSINNNQFAGALPPVAVCFSDYEAGYADVSNNQFTGGIPTGYCQCNFGVLRFDHNQLTGTLPTFSNPNLKILTLDNNLFGGALPVPFIKAPLAALSLSYNRLTSGIETFIYNKSLVSLISLDLSHNQFNGIPFDNRDPTDATPSEIFTSNNFKALLYLDLSHNNFSSLVFMSSVLPPNLQYIDLSYNQFHGVPKLNPIDRSYYIQLQTVILGNNRLGSGTLQPFTSVPSIKVLDLSNNPINDIIPATFGSLTSLEFLNLSSINAGGRPPNALKRLKSLQVLDLHRNNLVNSDLAWVSDLTDLQYLDLSENLLAVLPPGRNLRSLKTLDVSGNRMLGNLNDFCSLKSLNKFSVSRNFLSGPVCPFLSDIVRLRLDHNSFTGDASFLTAMPSLQYIDVSFNQLSQQLPSLNHLGNLNYANLSRNRFEGPVPYLSDLQNIISLDLSYNRFNDTIPSLPIDSKIDNNNFTWATAFVITENITFCSMSGMTLECPISLSARQRCNAICAASEMGTANISVRVMGDFESFNQTNAKRFVINDLRHGSVIVDMTITNPGNTSGEGSAVTLISQMQSPAFKESLATSNYTVLNIGSYIASPTASATASTSVIQGTNSIVNSNSKESSNTGTIVGVIVGVAVLITVAVVILAVIMYRRRARVMHSQVVMVDMSNMNMSPVEKSILCYEELENMIMIGSGAFGIVFSAQWRGIKVAVKQVKAEYVDEKQVSEFLHENLRPHPNVVLFMGITVPPSPLSIITEYCGGGSLLSYLRNNEEKVTLEEKMKFVTQIAQGMLHLHMEKIIHRDLAVRNILLTNHLDAKVADFGMSRQQMDDVQTTASTIGPIRWMAPEAMKERKYSHKTDVYSFGVLVWEIVTNREPYEDMDLMQVAISVMNNDLRPEIPDDTDPVLEKLMHGCWKKDPTERPNFAHICNFLGVDASDGKEVPLFVDDTDPYGDGLDHYAEADLPPVATAHYADANAGYADADANHSDDGL